LVVRADIERLLVRHSGRKGIAALRTVFSIDGGLVLTRSEAEVRFLALVRAADISRPLVNTRLCGFEVDFLWPDQRLVVEIDGFAFHGGRAAFEDDRDRDAKLAAVGYRVIRFTWRQLTRRPEAVLVRLAQTLIA